MIKPNRSKSKPDQRILCDGLSPEHNLLWKPPINDVSKHALDAMTRFPADEPPLNDALAQNDGELSSQIATAVLIEAIAHKGEHNASFRSIDSSRKMNAWSSIGE